MSKQKVQPAASKKGIRKRSLTDHGLTLTTSPLFSKTSRKLFGNLKRQREYFHIIGSPNDTPTKSD